MFRSFILFLFCSAVCLQSLAANYKPQYRLKDVKAFLQKEDIDFIQDLPDTYHYDWVNVPEDYDKQNGKRIYVFFYWKKFDTSKQKPFLFLNGGPGGSSHHASQLLPYYFPDVPIIFMDQRGTGCSSPYPEAIEENIPRYLHYLSRNIVKDAEAVRKQIIGKDKRWSIIGQSFGSLIAHRYVTIAPEGINSIHAHGFTVMDQQEKMGMERLKAHHKVSQRYFRAYPGDAITLSKIRKFLPDDFKVKEEMKKEGEVGVVFHGKGILDPLGLFMSFKFTWDSTHNRIKGLVNKTGRPSTPEINKAVLQQYIELMGYGEDRDVINILFNRYEAYIPKEASLTEYYENLFAELKAVGNDPNEWLIGEEARCHLSITSPIHDATDKYPLEKVDRLTPKEVAEALKKNPHIKFYLYASEHDAFCPPSAFKDIVRHCGQSIRYTKIRKGGHGSWMTSPKFLSEILIRN